MRYYLSDQSNPVDENHELWNRPLPTSRQGRPQSDDGSPKTILTYGEYFTAVQDFIHNYPDCFDNNNDSPPENISVYLEKHGAFYHPSRIAVDRRHGSDEYVLNVAFSQPGRQYLENEYSTLKMLEEKYAYSFLPKVFACQEMSVNSEKKVGMFTGEWFGSYDEFHLSNDPPEGSSGIKVWNAVKGGVFLSADQASALYGQAAGILTACYDFHTFEQISDWHHAAGDFVVNLEDSRSPRVKLITVRRYTPLLEAVEETTETMLNGLLLFLLNMSLHMRLDRLDGVKGICWADDFIVGATLSGFFQGLAIQQEMHRIPDDFVTFWKSFLSEIDLETLQELFKAIANRFPAGSPDLPIIQAHIEKHVHTFHYSLRSQQ